MSGIGRGSQVIGMDVDRGALKAVQLSKSGGSYVLRHVGYHRLPPGAIIEGEVADPDLLAAGDVCGTLEPVPVDVGVTLQSVQLDDAVLADLEVRMERPDVAAADHELALGAGPDEEALALDPNREPLALTGPDRHPHAACLSCVVAARPPPGRGILSGGGRLR